MHASSIAQHGSLELLRYSSTNFVRSLDNLDYPQTVFDYYCRLGDNDPRLTELGGLRNVLAQYKDLDWNWDGHEAVPVSEDTYRNAESFLNRLTSQTPLPRIYANPNGTISFQWKDRKYFAHLEIGKTRFSFYASQDENPQIELDGGVSDLEAKPKVEAAIQTLFGIHQTLPNQVSQLSYPYGQRANCS